MKYPKIQALTIEDLTVIIVIFDHSGQGTLLK